MREFGKTIRGLDTKLIVYEVDLQKDFMENNGRLYVPGAEEIKPIVGTIVTKVKSAGLTRVRSMDWHYTSDAELAENGGPFGKHCMNYTQAEKNADGTFGAEIIPEVQADTRIYIEDKLLDGKKRIYDPLMLQDFATRVGDFAIQKQSYDVFTNPATEKFLEALETKTAIVYGVATDYCVKAAVLGMQQRGIQCVVLEDAIAGITPNGSTAAITEMKAAGALFKTSNDLDAIIKQYK